MKLPVGVENFEKSAYSMMCSVVGREALRFQFLLESDKLTDKEKDFPVFHAGNLDDKEGKG